MPDDPLPWVDGTPPGGGLQPTIKFRLRGTEWVRQPSDFELFLDALGKLLREDDASAGDTSAGDAASG